MRYIPLFILIQVASAVLFVLGLPVCAVLSFLHLAHKGVDGLWHWQRFFWIYDNEEDGVDPTWYQNEHPDRSIPVNEFVWAALRNSVNNLRYVHGVSAKGRPLWIKTWNIRGRDYYIKAGWLSDGYPCLSGGRGKW